MLILTSVTVVTQNPGHPYVMTLYLVCQSQYLQPAPLPSTLAIARLVCDGTEALSLHPNTVVVFFIFGRLEELSWFEEENTWGS